MPHPKGGYRNKAGEKIVGVTTAIGNRVNSGGLMWWANRLAYEPLMKARALIAAAVAYAASDVVAAKEDLQNWYSFLEISDETFDHNKAAGLAADAGTLAHAMVEAHLKGKDPAEAITSDHTKEVIDKAETSYLAFLEWAEMTNLEVEEQELSLVSEGDQFGGTMDACVVTINGKRAIADWKTSNGLYPDHLIQVAAYRRLYEENFPDKPITGGLHIFRFSKDTGDFHHHFFQELEEAEEAFLLCLRLYQIDKNLKKRAK